jgi:hypothetical protein
MWKAWRNIGLLAGVVSLAGCTNGPGPGGNDDRPPIIVSDGSVHLRAVAKDRGTGTNYNRGVWEKDNASGNWVHTHGNDPAKHLLVSIIHGTHKDGTDCDKPEIDYDVRTLQFTYVTAANDSKTFDVFIERPEGSGAGRLMTNAAGQVDPKVSFWLDVGDPTDHLKSVTVSGVTCDLEPGLGQVQIYQRMK